MGGEGAANGHGQRWAELSHHPDWIGYGGEDLDPLTMLREIANLRRALCELETECISKALGRGLSSDEIADELRRG